MKVLCTRLPAPLDGVTLESSPWVTLDGEYTVVSVLAEPAGQVQIQILTDDGRSLGWFDSMNFVTVDGSVPDNWVTRIGERGEFELAPLAWLGPGFWESYYDGDPAAVDAVESELRTLLGGPSA